MVELMDLVWGREVHLDLYLNEESMEVMMWMTIQHQYSSFLKPMSMPNYY